MTPEMDDAKANNEPIEDDAASAGSESVEEGAEAQQDAEDAVVDE